MQGINHQKAKENDVRYRGIYQEWRKNKSTLQEIGLRHNITKQRVHQIITRCKLGDGDYYNGNRIAKEKWLEFVKVCDDKEKARELFNTWLADKDVKLAADNKKLAPHTGIEV